MKRVIPDYFEPFAKPRIHLAIGVAGGVVTVLLIALWNWISAGDLLRVLGGATQAEMGKVHQQVTVLESSMDSIREGNHECEWVSIGPDKSHGHDMTGWCSEDSFKRIRLTDKPSCPRRRVSMPGRIPRHASRFPRCCAEAAGNR